MGAGATPDQTEHVLARLQEAGVHARVTHGREATVIDVDGHRIGQEFFGLIAGPCSVEYREQTLETARSVASAGATMLRGGAVQPRASADPVQGGGGQGRAVLRG